MLTDNIPKWIIYWLKVTCETGIIIISAHETWNNVNNQFSLSVRAVLFGRPLIRFKLPRSHSEITKKIYWIFNINPVVCSNHKIQKQLCLAWPKWYEIRSPWKWFIYNSVFIFFFFIKFWHRPTNNKTSAKEIKMRDERKWMRIRIDWVAHYNRC